MKKLLLFTAFITTNVIADPIVMMKTNMGDITIDLNEAEAPKTVDNFLKYVKSDFYNGLTFHRVIKNFMIQGGGYDANYQQRPTRGPIANESQNGLKNLRGTIAMARTSDPHSATSQFFINQKDNDFLNPGGADPYGYTVFGHIIKGMDIVDKIANSQTGPAGPFSKDVPNTPIIIESVDILPDEEDNKSSATMEKTSDINASSRSVIGD